MGLVTDVSLSAQPIGIATARACLIDGDYVTLDGGEWTGGDDGANTIGRGIEATQAAWCRNIQNKMVTAMNNGRDVR